MATLAALAETLATQGYETTGTDRQEIPIVEHGEAVLPNDIIRSDGSFDLYDDVQTKFEIEYKRRQKRLIIRGGGWVGYVPLNDRYALRIDTRVPVTNLEQIISRSTSTSSGVRDWLRPIEKNIALLKCPLVASILCEQPCCKRGAEDRTPPSQHSSELMTLGLIAC